MNHIGTITMNTKRLILRKFDFTDAEDMLELWVSKPEIQHMYSEPTYNTIDEVNELLKKYIKNYDNNDYYRWAIVDNDSNRCIFIGFANTFNTSCSGNSVAYNYILFHNRHLSS